MALNDLRDQNVREGRYWWDYGMKVEPESPTEFEDRLSQLEKIVYELIEAKKKEDYF